jgi:hypothetical protein
MSHWAEIDETNTVLRVLVGDNNDPAGDEGYQWLTDNLGGTWVKTSYNSWGGIHYLSELNEEGQKVVSGQPHLRYNYAGVDFTYDPINDAFIPPKPAPFAPNGDPSRWILDETTFQWIKEIE